MRAGSWTATQVRAEVDSPTYLAGLFSAGHLCDRAPGEAGAGTGTGVPRGRCRHLRAHRGHRGVRRRRPASRHHYRRHGHGRSGLCWPPTFSPACSRRNRLYTVPVYDYVLSTDPLTDEQLDRIGWRGRQGVGDSRQPVPLLPVVGRQPDRLGRLRRDLPLRSQGRPGIRRPARRPTERLAAHFFLTFPQLEDVALQPPLGRGDRHQHAILRALGHRPPTAGSPTSTASPAWASARRASPPTCAWTCSTGRRHGGPGWRWCARNRCRFHRNRWPASGSRQLAGRSITRTTARESAIYS